MNSIMVKWCWFFTLKSHGCDKYLVHSARFLILFLVYYYYCYVVIIIYYLLI